MTRLTLKNNYLLDMDRKNIADLIIARMRDLDIESLKSQYKNSSKINYLVIDDLLPSKVASDLNYFFPEKTYLKLRNQPQEKKYTAVNWESKSPIVEECLYSFQDERVIKLFSKICNIKDLSGDPELYAGGLSFMNKGCFLNPHIDNSHDRLRERYRRLNLLYYITESWDPSNDGGELFLYPDGIKFKPVKIPAKFNRLVIMRTDKKSLHGVSEITSNSLARKCISNYYFSYSSPSSKNYYHSTSFRGFKGEFLKDIFLRTNASLRTSIKFLTGNLFGKIINTGHHRKNNDQ